MAKLTMAQAEKWSAKLSNGFKFDIQRYLMWSEKQAVKNIEFSDGRVLQASLHYMDVVENYRTVGLQPVCHVSIWTPCENSDFMQSSGLGAQFKIGEVQTKKNYNVLCKLSETLDDETIINFAKENLSQLNNAFVV